MITEHQHEVIQWAKALVNQEPLFLDTETTGLDGRSEIVQLALVELDGTILHNSLIIPSRPIPMEATRIHGITTEKAQAEGLAWEHVAPLVAGLIMQRALVIYNADYDLRMLYRTDNHHKTGMFFDWNMLADSHCAMERYAEYFGDWNEYRGNYRWIKLTDACRFQGIPDPENAPAHSALGDALRTLALVKHLASREVG